MEIRGSSNTSGHIRSRTQQKRTSPSKVLSNSDSSQRLASSSVRTTHEASSSAHTRPDSTHRGPSPPSRAGASASIFHVQQPPGHQKGPLSSPEQARNAPNVAHLRTCPGLVTQGPADLLVLLQRSHQSAPNTRHHSMNTRVVRSLLVAIADEAWPSLTSRCQMQGHPGLVKTSERTSSHRFRISSRWTMAQQEHLLPQ